MSKSIEQLQAAYPLPSGWSVPEIYSESVFVDEAQIFTLGLATQNAEGMMVTGSAADRAPVANERAYFELLERVSVVEAKQISSSQWDGFNEERVPISTIASEDLFPESPVPERWRYARSNGVAAHTDWNRACRSAHAELVERDHVLRSWFGETVPQRLPENVPPQVSDLTRAFDIQLFQFPPPPAWNTGFTVVGSFGFTKTPEAPFIFGFAARESTEAAIRSACDEWLQRLAFLWGEPIEQQVAFSPTPDYHQERYLGSDGEAKVREWLRGRHVEVLNRKPTTQPTPYPHYADITPAVLRGRAAIVKALASDLLPLIFGYAALQPYSEAPESLAIHPIG